MKILSGFHNNEYFGVESFEELGEVTYKRYNHNWLLNNISLFEVLLTHLYEELDKEVIDAGIRLKVIATPSTGTNHIDIGYVESMGLKVVSLNQNQALLDSITSTAEMAFLQLLSLHRKMRALQARIYEDASWLNTDIRGFELNGKTLGIIGFGRLGKIMARYAHAFGMRVLVHDIDPKVFENAPNYIEEVSKSKLLEGADAVSLHVKLNPSSQHLIDFDEVGLMKEGVFLVNTSRGEIVNPQAIIKGIEDQIIAGYSTDVLNNEFNNNNGLPDDPLLNFSMRHKNVLITPHAGGSTYDAHQKVFIETRNLVKMVLEETI